MSVLSDRDLRARLPEIVSPYDEARTQPSSYDVMLGPSFRVPENHEVFYVDLADPPTGMMRELVLPPDGYVVLHPGDFVLGSTSEWVEVPADLVCRLEGKSSVGRLGLLIHATAGFIDPGYRGNITLEMTNFLRVPIILRPGLEIAQLAFQQLTSEVERPYAGRYQCDSGATESRYGRSSKTEEQERLRRDLEYEMGPDGAGTYDPMGG